ncbi:MAG: RND transporter, partial [Comamonas thiooxydans]
MDSDMKTMQGIRSLMPSLSALTAALVLAGCASAPPTVAEHAGLAVPASFSA